MISKIVKSKVLGDRRGKLVVFEANEDVPFDIKRVFHIYGTQPNVSRGNHAHYKTKQFLIAVNGSCKVTLDNGVTKETFVLNAPHLGLFQDVLVWGVMHDFSNDCILLVLASEHYDENDYVIEYNHFLKEVKK